MCNSPLWRSGAAHRTVTAEFVPGNQPGILDYVTDALSSKVSCPRKSYPALHSVNITIRCSLSCCLSFMKLCMRDFASKTK